MTKPANTATHRPLNMAGIRWVDKGRLATFEASRPGFAVQCIATGEVLARAGVTPSIWRTKSAAAVIAEYPMGWPTVAIQPHV